MMTTTNTAAKNNTSEATRSATKLVTDSANYLQQCHGSTYAQPLRTINDQARQIEHASTYTPADAFTFSGHHSAIYAALSELEQLMQNETQPSLRSIMDAAIKDLTHHANDCFIALGFHQPYNHPITTFGLGA